MWGQSVLCLRSPNTESPSQEAADQELPMVAQGELEAAPLATHRGHDRCQGGELRS